MADDAKISIKLAVYTSDTEVIIIQGGAAGVKRGSFDDYFGPNKGRNVKDYNLETVDLDEGVRILPSLRVK